jgi:GNAT superfamily N-acetyltransferase
MNITPAKAAQARELSALVLAAAEELRGVDFDAEGWARFVASNMPSDFERKLNSPEFLCYCALEQQKILGFIAMKDSEKIDQLFVLPQARRRGLAQHLWSRARLEAETLNTQGHFWVRSSSVAQPVYAGFGFSTEGEAQVFMGIRFWLMRLDSATLNSTTMTADAR